MRRDQLFELAEAANPALTRAMFGIKIFRQYLCPPWRSPQGIGKYGLSQDNTKLSVGIRDTTIGICGCPFGPPWTLKLRNLSFLGRAEWTTY